MCLHCSHFGPCDEQRRSGFEPVLSPPLLYDALGPGLGAGAASGPGVLRVVRCCSPRDLGPPVARPAPWSLSAKTLPFHCRSSISSLHRGRYCDVRFFACSLFAPTACPSAFLRSPLFLQGCAPVIFTFLSARHELAQCEAHLVQSP